MKKYKDRILASLLIVFAVLVVSWFIHDDFAQGSVNQKPAGAQTGQFRTFTFFASSTTQINFGTTTTATTTSTAIDSYFDSFGAKDNGYFVVAGAKRVTMWFSRYDATPATGTSTFMVQYSKDGIAWIDSSKLISNVPNTNSQTIARTSGLVYAGVIYGLANNSATSSMSIDVTNDSIYAVRCLANSAVDGTNYCSATADW